MHRKRCFLSTCQTTCIKIQLLWVQWQTLACLSFTAPLSFANDNDTVLGTWLLVSYEVKAQATGQKGPVMRDPPTGYAAFLPNGRVFFILTGEARKPAKSDKERAELLSTLASYSGTYRIESDKWKVNGYRC